MMWKKLVNLANIMPFTNVLSANYFLLYSVVASYTCSSCANILPHQNFPTHSTVIHSLSSYCFTFEVSDLHNLLYHGSENCKH